MTDMFHCGRHGGYGFTRDCETCKESSTEENGREQSHAVSVPQGSADAALRTAGHDTKRLMDDFARAIAGPDAAPAQPTPHLACGSHCCAKHGCKYGYDDCPVVLGKEPGVHCERCDLDEAAPAQPRHLVQPTPKENSMQGKHRHAEFTKWFLAWRKSIRAPDDGSTDEARSCAWKVWGLKERELAAMTALQHATHADFETISNQLAAANARADDAEVALKETGEALARTDTLLLMERTAREKAIIFVGELRADKTELSGMLHDNQVGSNELGKQLAAAEYRLATIAAETIERCAKVCYADAEKCASQPGSMRERNEALFLMHAIRALSTKEKRG